MTVLIQPVATDTWWQATAGVSNVIVLVTHMKENHANSVSYALIVII